MQPLDQVIRHDERPYAVGGLDEYPEIDVRITESFVAEPRFLRTYRLLIRVDGFGRDFEGNLVDVFEVAVS